MRKVDLIIGCAAVAFGGIAFQQSMRYAFYNGIPGAGFLPRVLAAAIILLGGLLVVTRTVVPAGRFPAFAPPSLPQLGRASSVVAVIAVGAFLMPIVGFVPSMMVLVGGLLLGIEGKRNIPAIVTIIALPLLLSWLFGDALGVRLPRGPLGL